MKLHPFTFQQKLRELPPIQTHGSTSSDSVLEVNCIF